MPGHWEEGVRKLEQTFGTFSEHKLSLILNQNHIKKLCSGPTHPFSPTPQALARGYLSAQSTGAVLYLPHPCCYLPHSWHSQPQSSLSLNTPSPFEPYFPPSLPATGGSCPLVGTTSAVPSSLSNACWGLGWGARAHRRTPARMTSLAGPLLASGTGWQALVGLGCQQAAHRPGSGRHGGWLSRDGRKKELETTT